MIYTPQIWHPQHFHKGILTPPPPPPPPRLLPLRVMPRLVSFRSLEFKLYREYYQTFYLGAPHPPRILQSEHRTVS